MPSCEVRSNSPSSRDAPSSMEYSVWTCRCTKSEPSLALTRVPSGSRLQLSGRSHDPAQLLRGRTQTLPSPRVPDGTDIPAWDGCQNLPHPGSAGLAYGPTRPSPTSTSVGVADDLERVLQVRRIRRLELDPLPRLRVRDAQLDLVQPLALEPDALGQHRIAAVEGVAHARMLQG